MKLPLFMLVFGLSFPLSIMAKSATPVFMEVGSPYQGAQSVIMDYAVSPQNMLPLTDCSFSVTRVAVGNDHYTFATATWLETEIKVNQALLTQNFGAVETLAVGLVVHLHSVQENSFPPEALYLGVQQENGGFRIQTTFDRVSGSGAQRGELTDYVPFVDFRRQDKTIVRLLFNSISGGVFTLQNSFESYPQKVLSQGNRIVRSVTEKSPLLFGGGRCL